ncbi:MAG: alanine racemase, partial [Megasphaera elsdenii]|nr:alanine racemase [Megasphaera elsdenii]
MNAYESTMNFTRRAVWAQIDLDAAAHNMRQIRKHVGPDVKIAAVVKANAYGHGSVELAKTFAENGADCFAVSSLDEAVELRRYAHIDKEIFILGHTDARRTEELLTYDI